MLARTVTRPRSTHTGRTCPHHRQRYVQNHAAPAAAGAGEAAEEGPTAAVRVDVGHAIEQITVPLLSSSNKVSNCTMRFPLGLVLEDTADGIAVTEVTPGSHADAAGVRVGDVLRGTTAARMQMTYPAMNLMFGGVGRPKLVRILIPTSGISFSTCMEAVRSNRELDGSITLVLERQCVEPAASSGGGKEAERSSVFDPRIFE